MGVEYPRAELEVMGSAGARHELDRLASFSPVRSAPAATPEGSVELDAMSQLRFERYAKRHPNADLSRKGAKIARENKIRHEGGIGVHYMSGLSRDTPPVASESHGAVQFIPLKHDEFGVEDDGWGDIDWPSDDASLGSALGVPVHLASPSSSPAVGTTGALALLATGSHSDASTPTRSVRGAVCQHLVICIVTFVSICDMQCTALAAHVSICDMHCTALAAHVCQHLQYALCGPRGRCLSASWWIAISATTALMCVSSLHSASQRPVVVVSDTGS